MSTASIGATGNSGTVNASADQRDHEHRGGEADVDAARRPSSPARVEVQPAARAVVDHVEPLVKRWPARSAGTASRNPARASDPEAGATGCSTFMRPCVGRSSASTIGHTGSPGRPSRGRSSGTGRSAHLEVGDAAGIRRRPESRPPSRAARPRSRAGRRHRARTARDRQARRARCSNAMRSRSPETSASGASIHAWSRAWRSSASPRSTPGRSCSRVRRGGRRAPRTHRSTRWP